jgi:hypothetical protein
VSRGAGKSGLLSCGTSAVTFAHSHSTFPPGPCPALLQPAAPRRPLANSYAGSGNLQAAGVGVQPPEHHTQCYVQAQAQQPGNRQVCAWLGRPTPADTRGVAAERRHTRGAIERGAQGDVFCGMHIQLSSLLPLRSLFKVMLPFLCALRALAFLFHYFTQLHDSATSVPCTYLAPTSLRL